LKLEKEASDKAKELEKNKGLVRKTYENHFTIL